MVFKKRWFLATILILCFTLIFTGCDGYGEISVEDPTAEFYVNDFAEVFSEDQKANMMEKAVNLNEQTGGIQVVITTVKSLQGYTIEDYAHAMYNQYGIGEESMGALILLSTEDRKVRIEVGNNMETYLTDSISGRLMDENSMEHFRQDEFDIGLIKLQDAVISHILSTVPEDWNEGIPTPETETPVQNLHEKPVVDEKENVDADKPQTTLSNDTSSNIQKKTGKSGLAGIISAIAVALLSCLYSIKETFSTRKYKGLYKENAAKLTKLEYEHAEELRLARQEAEQRVDVVRSHYSGIVSEREDSLRQKDITIRSLQDDISSHKQEISILKKDLSASKEKFSRAERLHPDIEEKIAEQIQQELREQALRIEQKNREEALRINQKLAGIISQEADKDKVSLFREARSIFLSTSPEIMQYVKTDKYLIEKLCTESESLLREFERQQKEIADKATANRINEQMEELVRRYSEGRYSNYQEFERVNRRYEALSREQKAFIAGTILSAFMGLLKESKRDFNLYNEAKESEHRISNIIGHMYSAQEDDRNKLKKAMRYYKSIPTEQLKYFDSNLYEKLKKLISQADDDHEEQERRRRREREEEERRRRREEEERRRRNATHSSFNNFGSRGGGSYSGHGGRSSGGGASRSF